MGIPYDDVVIIKQSEKLGDPSMITVNCPDKTGLGCDLCRIILFFGLNIVKGDFSTDGKWCYVVFWVVEKSRRTRWSSLKKRLLEACPSCYSTSGIYFYRNELQQPKPPQLFLLKFCCTDRKGLLHDVTEVLCDLELIIWSVKVSTTPDDKVMDLFFITDSRELLHTKQRQEDTCNHLRSVLGDALISCEIELSGSEVLTCSTGSSLPPAITEEMFGLELGNNHPLSKSSPSNEISVTVDNSLSPAHTLIQIVCVDHKGLLYDMMRTLKDYNMKISYGRFSIKQGQNCELDLFIVQADGKKILDPNKLNALCSRLQAELLHPFKVAVVSRGPDSELLVVNPVELSGLGRPLVFYDVTLALKMLKICIFTADIGRHIIGDKECEVYRILLGEGNGLSMPSKKIEGQVRKMLMGWE
ncbi:hypothetical protein MKW94_021315 [Papaver nudicaule]|uniref:ACT domain-containing protein ACR n=1 Tax=Papaver nudicaule TaxID=74823 RepID=A0AA41VPM5_PAPNU|nr:hypothetical protein [Papaver nudicaule]